jgi:DNA repair exonuclease SbcCD ATPase subunit
MSEEINDMEEDKKSGLKWRKEIQALKDELALAKRSANEDHSHGTEEVSNSSVKIRELEQQLGDMREQMRERSMTVEPTAAATFHDLPTPEIDIFVDNTDDDIVAPVIHDDGGLHELTSSKEAATQASLLPPAHTETFREARLSLEYMFPGEITLGLVPEDPKPLLDIMFERMRRLKADLLFTEDQLSTTATSESNIRTQFNAVLEQLDRARKYGETISTRIANEKARADTSEAKVQSLAVTVQAAASKIEVMEKESHEKERSMGKLQNALESYRVEVVKLESLITTMEADHNTAISAVRAEMDEAVADLECHVVAETHGRREAEQEVAERNEKIKELKVHEQELKEALNEKQQIIRKTEKVFEQERISREREVGGLNVQIGQLTSDLSESDAKVTAGEAKQAILMRKLEEERDAGLRAVEAVQEKLAHAKEKAEGIKTAYIHDVQRRGDEVNQSQGLLTPITVTRFKDVDVQGYVQVRRGKGKAKKRDSGILILEEDEDEDTIMADEM